MFEIFFYLAAMFIIQGNMYVPDVLNIYDTEFLNEIKVLENVLENEQYDRRELDQRASGISELAPEIPLSYDLNDLDNYLLKNNIRDQEYLQHSSLWGRQQLNDFIKLNRHKIKQDFKDPNNNNNNQLPAYCTPPNPCPVGYTKENNCIEDFENTAEFSREFQSSQDCMCDKEHMMECSKSDIDVILSNEDIPNSEFEQIVERYEDENPYFEGEKLPIAAKKGFNVGA